MSISAVVIAVVVSFLAAFCFSRFRPRGTNFLMFILLSIRLLPERAVILPVYLMFANFGWKDSHLALILFYAMFSIPFSVWILRRSVMAARSFAEKAELTLIVSMIVGIIVITLSPRILWMHQTGLAILAVSTILQIAVSNLPKDADMKTSLVRIAIILCIIAAVFLIGIALVPALGQLGR